MAALDKTADLAGPGIGDYAELERVLPDDYTPLLTPKRDAAGARGGEAHIEDGLCRELEPLPRRGAADRDRRAGSTTTSTATARARR